VSESLTYQRVCAYPFPSPQPTKQAIQPRTPRQIPLDGIAGLHGRHRRLGGPGAAVVGVGGGDGQRRLVGAAGACVVGGAYVVLGLVDV
jgi:hypothetical protein